MLLSLQDVTFGYSSSVAPIFSHVTLAFDRGWTGVVGANGSGKTTLLRLACQKLVPDDGQVRLRGDVVHCAQRADVAPSSLTALLGADDSEACRLRRVLSLREDFVTRWSSLSHGERKRAQIAVALSLHPDILALDEPTNHLDAHARSMLIAALSRFGGIGLVVSHDRDLLDGLCQRCVFIDPPKATILRGTYSESSSLRASARAQRERRQELAKKEIERLERTAASRRHEAARADVRRSARHIDPRDHDARGKINLARVTNRDGRAGQLTRQLQGRLQKARAGIEELRTEKIYTTGIWLPNSRAHRDRLLELAPFTLELGPSRKLAIPHLRIGPTSRIALTGDNGAGKSTLVRHLLRQIELSAEKVVYLAQELEEDEIRRTTTELAALTHEELGQVMTIVSRLGSRPDRLLETLAPSPGELRKVVLARGILRAPHLLVLDEPTNHLDLPAIECLQEALAACPSALVLISHDQALLRALTTTRWHLEGGALHILTGP